MRRIIFVGCVALTAGIGLTIGALEGSWGLAILFGLKFTVIGMAIGVFLSGIWRRSSRSKKADDEPIVDDELERVSRLGGQGMSPEEVSANYWRDKGHAPFMNPEDHDLRG